MVSVHPISRNHFILSNIAYRCSIPSVDPQLQHFLLHADTECTLPETAQIAPILLQGSHYKRPDGTVDRHDPAFSRRRFDTAPEIPLPQVGLQRLIRADAEAGITHDQDHPDDRILRVRPQDSQLLICKILAVHMIRYIRHHDILRRIFRTELPRKRIPVQLPQHGDRLLHHRLPQPDTVHHLLQIIDTQLIHPPLLHSRQLSENTPRIRRRLRRQPFAASGPNL